MSAPWIRVHALLAARPVVYRLAPLCGDDLAKAVGHLVILWGNVSVHAENGFVRDYPDAQLEKWAEWNGPRGDFAAWLRKYHLDEDGRIRDWDEYAGALEARRAKERARVATRRSDPLRCTHGVAQQTRDVVQQSHGVRTVLQPARANETTRDDTRRDETRTPESTPPPPTAPATATGREQRSDGEIAFLTAIPESQRTKWEAIIDGWHSGMGYAGGKAADPRDVSVGLLEYLAATSAPDFAPRHVVKFIEAAERRRTEMPSDEPQRALPNRRRTRGMVSRLLEIAEGREGRAS